MIESPRCGQGTVPDDTVRNFACCRGSVPASPGETRRALLAGGLMHLLHHGRLALVLVTCLMGSGGEASIRENNLTSDS